jgi:hypothetical protein
MRKVYSVARNSLELEEGIILEQPRNLVRIEEILVRTDNYSQ